MTRDGADDMKDGTTQVVRLPGSTAPAEDADTAPLARDARTRSGARGAERVDPAEETTQVLRAGVPGATRSDGDRRGAGAAGATSGAAQPDAAAVAAETGAALRVEDDRRQADRRVSPGAVRGAGRPAPPDGGAAPGARVPQRPGSSPRPAVRTEALSNRTSPTRRRARLSLKRVDPWSVFVLALLISLFLAIALLVAVAVLHSLLSSLGVLESVDSFAQELELLDPGQSLLSSGRVLGLAAVLAAVDVVLLTVLATLGAFLYNICASLTGGIEVVLSERD